MIRTLINPDPASLGNTVEEFLRYLGQASEIRVSGRDSSRWRVVAALVHGNEPSGPTAAWRFLTSGVTPAVDTSLFVLSVQAALKPPGFAHRMLPGTRDLNRCFLPPFGGPNGTLAEEMLSRLHSRPCEALVDLHNNTGQNPAYGIINAPSRARLKLVELFTKSCCVLTDLSIGALTEVVMHSFPSAAVECGHSDDPAAHALALAGIERFVGMDDLHLDGDLDRGIALFDHPVRVKLRPGVRVAFADQPDPDADLTLLADIDTHNFRALARGTQLGWVKPGTPWPIEARGVDSNDITRDHFVIGGGTLSLASDLVPVMMTTNAKVAAQDCLFYLMRQRDWLAELETR